MLRLHRASDSHATSLDGCPHCPQDSTSQRRAAHKLPCGHRLCTQALRTTVRAATDSALGSVPSCCGKPIPGSVVEAVMTQGEQIALLEKLDQWDEAISLAPSDNTSRPTSTIPPLSDCSRATSSSGCEDNPSQEVIQEIERILALPDYQNLLAKQRAQRTRFLNWAGLQRSSLSEQHDRLRTAMRTGHEAAAEDLAEAHASALAEAEDKQVSAEAEMRETHEKERVSSATALKHMETYCAGVYSNGEPHGRNITEQDIEQLNFARRERDLMPAKHSSAINVLRGEQHRRIKLRGIRQERQAQELVRTQRMEELEFERGCSAEVTKLETSLEAKKRRIEWRWELECAVLAKRVGECEGEVVKLPTAGWDTRRDSKIPEDGAKGDGITATYVEELKSA